VLCGDIPHKGGVSSRRLSHPPAVAYIRAHLQQRQRGDGRHPAGAPHPPSLGRIHVQIEFLGAAGTVTGSKYLLRRDGGSLLVDCGLFQGTKALRLKNREPFPVPPAEVGAVVLTHAHLDHSGALPLLVRDGFRGPIHCTSATADLCEILLLDSGRLQEEEAAYANRHGYSRHRPALPLYTVRDAERAIERLRPLSGTAGLALPGGFEARFVPSGHILGAASVRMEGPEGAVVFSGDVGWDAMLPEPEHPGDAEWVVLESTYGDRVLETIDPATALAGVVAETAGRGGAVIVPAFAVGRAQTLLWLLLRLRREGRLPDVPVYLDSPMAARALEVMRRHPEAHRLTPEDVAGLARVAEIVESPAESRRVMLARSPRVIISASGMVTGGRVLHHLRTLAPDPRNTILFTGYQAPGTRGAEILAGRETVKMLGEHVRIAATVRRLESLSAHADQAGLLRWMGRFDRPPRRCFLTHGEPHAARALARRAGEEPGWNCSVPALGERVELS
jgi:metallo-beta-lactamase family protein